MNAPYCLFKTEKKRVVWEVTHRCNYACVHCCSRAGKSQEKEMDMSRIKEILSQLSKIGVEEIYYSGGEPFIRDDMIDILRETRKRGILANVSTNGSFLTVELAEELKRIDVNLIHISLDSNNEESFNRFRGGEYYLQTVKAIKNAKLAGLYVRVGVVIWKENIDSIKEMIDFLCNLGVDEVVFNWLIIAGRFQDNIDMGVSLSEFDKTIALVRNYMHSYKQRIKISMHRSEKYFDDGSVCCAGKSILFILPDGRISPCSWLAKMDSDTITKESLDEADLNVLMSSDTFLKMEDILKERSREYKAGCPAICLERTGSYFSEDPLLKNGD